MSNPSNFRNLDYPALLYESLTGSFSINKAGQVAVPYKFCAACLAPLVAPFADFVAFRDKEYLIANCKFQIGQLTNVLNFLYDKDLNRIFITQSVGTPEYFWEFPYLPSMYLPEFGDDVTPPVYLREFGDQTAATLVTINVPAGINLSDLTATVAQINITGINYKIVTI